MSVLSATSDTVHAVAAAGCAKLAGEAAKADAGGIGTLNTDDGAITASRSEWLTVAADAPPAVASSDAAHRPAATTETDARESADAKRLTVPPRVEKRKKLAGLAVTRPRGRTIKTFGHYCRPLMIHPT
jgi:hypothetical protein